MRDIILSIPEQLRTGIKLGASQNVISPKGRIISCGMGGSSVAGELLSMVRDNVIVHWDYDLPSHTSPDDLVICTSWSGATEETISSYKAARSLGASTLVITSGGELAALAANDGSPCILLPASNTIPRVNVALMTAALFGALSMEQYIPTSFDVASLEQQGAELATRIGDRSLALYAAYPWRKLTGIWKMVYSETAKRQVMANWFPSGAHNEVVGWEGPYQDTTTIIAFRERNESINYAKNFDALLAILTEKGYTVTTVALSGDSLIEKALTSYTLSLWTSYAVAQSLGIDSQTTELLNAFKRLKATS